jgi:hypothetical protein
MDDWVKIIAFQLKQMSEAAKMPKKWVATYTYSVASLIDERKKTVKQFMQQ